jgi:hypothetical protein
MYRILIAVFTMVVARSAYAEKVFYLHDPGGNVAAHIYTYSQVNAEYDSSAPKRTYLPAS